MNILTIFKQCPKCDEGYLYTPSRTIDDALVHGTEVRVGECDETFCNKGCVEVEYEIKKLFDKDNFLDEDFLINVNQDYNNIEIVKKFLKENNLIERIKSVPFNFKLLENYKLKELID